MNALNVKRLLVGRSGFTLIELIVVIAIVTLLAALLFSVFASVREKGRSIVCLSNLRQIGMAVSLYSNDYDDLFPWGIDSVDQNSAGWVGSPYETTVHNMPRVDQVLAPYISSKQIWRCPSDSGFSALDSGFSDLDTIIMSAAPTQFNQYGMSYGYRTELALTGQKISTLSGVETAPPYSAVGPSDVNVFFDDCGYWHGYGVDSGRRYNVVMADGHAVSQAANQFWLTDSYGIKLNGGAQ
jgi:general secretion pathway protein G